MQTDVLLFLRVVFILCFVATAFAGFVLIRNLDRFFGVDLQVPSETAGARAYNRTQIFLVWALALKLFAMAALLV